MFQQYTWRAKGHSVIHTAHKPKCSRIYQPYFEKYSEAVCGNVPLRAQEACMTHMIIPDFQEQQHIIEQLNALQSTTELGSAEGAAMLLIKNNDLETLKALVESLHAYHDALQTIQAIVLDTLTATQ